MEPGAHDRIQLGRSAVSTIIPSHADEAVIALALRKSSISVRELYAEVDYYLLDDGTPVSDQRMADLMLEVIFYRFRRTLDNLLLCRTALRATRRSSGNPGKL